MFDSHTIKKDFPIFQHHPNLVYLDSAATSLKPKRVIEAEQEFYEQYGVNVHRGVYALSVKATEMYEGAREKVRKFINAKSTKEIVFVRGTTEAINLVAETFGQQLRRGDVVLTTEMEHHSNIVPWMFLTTPSSPSGESTPPQDPSLSRRDSDPLIRGGRVRRGIEGTAQLRWIPVTDDGQLDLSNIDELLKGVKLVAVTHMSNVLGTLNDVKTIIKKAHAAGALVLVDAAQSVPHMPVDVQDLDADFLVFSGHKMLGPTGIGVLYAKEEILKTLEPYQRGGDMILEVTKEKAIWNELPWKFEAGTPNIAGVIGLGAAIDYLENLGMENVWRHERELADYGLAELGKISGVTVLGSHPPTPLPRPPLFRAKRGSPSLSKEGHAGGGAERSAGGRGRGAIFAFTIDGVHPVRGSASNGIHPHDIGSIFDEQNIAIRAGHHCTQPLHKRFGLVATARASGYLYNTKEDIDALVSGIQKVQETFA